MFEIITAAKLAGPEYVKKEIIVVVGVRSTQYSLSQVSASTQDRPLTIKCQ